jgi:hypothetical protein
METFGVGRPRRIAGIEQGDGPMGGDRCHQDETRRTMRTRFTRRSLSHAAQSARRALKPARLW